MLTIADLHINSDVLDFNLLNTCLNFKFLLIGSLLFIILQQ